MQTKTEQINKYIEIKEKSPYVLEHIVLYLF